MKSRGIKGLVLAGVLSVVSICGVSAQDYSDAKGIVAKTKYKCNNIADYKHAHFSKSTCDDKGLVINLSSRRVLVNENYKQQVGAPVETFTRLPLAKETILDERVAKEAYYKDQASM